MNDFKTFLFIDDSQNDNFYTLSIIELDQLPIRPHFELSPVQALQYLKQTEISTFPDVIIIDINMPFMDGFEFVDTYMESFYPSNPDTLLFITSSSSRPSEISKVRQYKMVADFLQKPFTKQIFDKIMRHIKKPHKVA